MSDLKQRLDNLPPEKRARLEQLFLNKRAGAGGASSSRAGSSIDKPIPRRSSAGPAPLSFEQERLWFLDQWAPGTPTYNAALRISLTGPLDVDALRKTFDSIVQRHEVLRTTYRVVGQHPVQEVQTARSAGTRFFDARGLPEESRQAAIDRLIREECRRPFNLAKHLMMRTAILRVSENQHILLIVAHHIACDGWTRDLLFHEISQWYAFHSAGTPVSLAPLSIQYADFAAWQREFLQGPALEEKSAYWKRQLDGCAPHINLPIDYPRAAVQVHAGAHYFFDLPAKIASAAAAFSRAESSTLFITYLAALDVLLYAWTGQDDILIGTPMANRGRVETEPLLGFFANTVVVRARLEKSLTFRALVGRVKKMALEAYSHQDMPLGKLVEEMRMPRDMSRNPLFQVNFRVRTVAGPELVLPGIEARLGDLDIGVSKFDMALELCAQAQGTSGFFEYNTSLFKRETIEGICAGFVELMEEIVAHADTAIAELESFQRIRQSASTKNLHGEAHRFSRARRGVELGHPELSGGCR